MAGEIGPWQPSSLQGVAVKTSGASKLTIRYLFLLSARRPTDQALRSRARDRERRCRAGSPTEISFNATLMKELRMIALMRQLADPGSGEGGRWAKLRL